MLRVDGSTWGWQYRPDDPRLRDGRPVKYETPWQQRNGLDIPPGVGDQLDDPSVPLWVTEGCKKADCGAIHGLCIVALSGVWCWLGTNAAGGKMALPDWRDIALNGRRVVLAFDGDVARKPAVQKALHALAQYLSYKGAHVEYLWLPDTDTPAPAGGDARRRHPLPVAGPPRNRRDPPRRRLPSAGRCYRLEAGAATTTFSSNTAHPNEGHAEVRACAVPNCRRPRGNVGDRCRIHEGLATRRGEGWVAALAAILRDTPRLDGAACIGRAELFSSHSSEDIAAATGICRRCLALAACQQWANSRPRSKRPDGVVAGQHREWRPARRPATGRREDSAQ